MNFDVITAQTSAIPIVRRRARLFEIAWLAGVGTATVDRVLHNRANVRDETRQRVLQAKQAIESGADLRRQTRSWRLKIFLPDAGGQSTEFLADCFQKVSTDGRVTVECSFSTKLEPAVLARRLRACAGQGIDAVGFQALDDPRVRSAVEELARLNIPCVPILSDLVSPDLAGFIGIDNLSAGKTAGFLMGKMSRQAGPVAIISGGKLYRQHTNREMGFRAILRQDFRHFDVVGTFSGHDDNDGNHEAVSKVLHHHPDLVGLYNVGGGNTGIVHALKEKDLTEEIMFIGHNLTPKTVAYLRDRSMDVVVHQNMRRVAEQAVQALIARLENREHTVETIPVEVITRENIPGAIFG